MRGGGDANAHQDALLSRMYQRIAEVREPHFAAEYDLRTGMDRYQAWLDDHTEAPASIPAADVTTPPRRPPTAGTPPPPPPAVQGVRPAGRHARPGSLDRRGSRAGRIHRHARRMAPAEGRRQGARLPAAGGGEPVSFRPAAPDGGREERAETGPGHAERRTRGHGPAGALRGHRRASRPARAAARSHCPALLRGPVRGGYRRHDADQPRRGEESHRARYGLPQGGPGAGRLVRLLSGAAPLAVDGGKHHAPFGIKGAVRDGHGAPSSAPPRGRLTMCGMTAQDETSRAAILTVDDDPGVSRAVARDLRRQYGNRYRIVRAESASDALDAL